MKKKTLAHFYLFLLAPIVSHLNLEAVDLEFKISFPTQPAPGRSPAATVDQGDRTGFNIQTFSGLGYFMLHFAK